MTATLFDPEGVVDFFVPGVVVGKQRARSTASGHHYTPAKTVNYEATVRLAAQAAMSGREVITGAVDVVVTVQVVPSESWSKKRKAASLAGEEFPTGKPDADNVLKTVFDGMNGIVWRDDVLVVTALGRKRFATTPGVRVVVLPPGTLLTMPGIDR